MDDLEARICSFLGNEVSTRDRGELDLGGTGNEASLDSVLAEIDALHAEFSDAFDTFTKSEHVLK